MHLSDLHRNVDGLVKNDQLLTSLVLDADNYTNQKSENIPKPSVIIISGDIIFGSTDPEFASANIEIKSQYQEALNFLNLLTEQFLNGDKSRIVVIPGNHDVQWGVTKACLEKIDHSLLTPELKRAYLFDLFDPRKCIRWSWDDLNFYKIYDEHLYNSRMALFAEFYSEFYEGKRNFSLDPDEQFDIFDMPSLGLTIAGYNSCFRNDHLNRSGLINAKCLSASYNQIREYNKKGRLVLATWHHNFSGLPNDNTYLDPRQLKTLNSYGFALGFYGHQHRSDIVVNYVHFDNSKKLIAISAGSLCSARSHLPTGFKRQYNIIKVDRHEKTCRLFSRESIGFMDDIPLWDKGRINESMNSSLMLDISFPDVVTSHLTNAEVDTLTLLLKTNNFDELLKQVNLFPFKNDFIRSLVIELDSQTNGRYREQVCELLETPLHFKESIIFLNYYLENGWKDKASLILKDALNQNAGNDLLVKELQKYKIRINGY